MLIIQSILFFVLGVGCASFFMLLLAPIIWRRALVLAHQAVRMEVPLSLNEVEAEHDFARAVHAIELCRLEERVARAKSHEMAARLKHDMAQAKICYLAPFEEEAVSLQQTLIEEGAARIKLQQENDALHLQLKKLTGWVQKNQQERSRLKTQKAMIKALKRQLSALRKQCTWLEQQKDRLEAQQQARRKRDEMADEQLPILRQEIKQISAHIIANIALDQSATSPLPAMGQKGENKNDLAQAIDQAMRVRGGGEKNGETFGEEIGGEKIGEGEVGGQELQASS